MVSLPTRSTGRYHSSKDQVIIWKSLSILLPGGDSVWKTLLWSINPVHEVVRGPRYGKVFFANSDEEFADWITRRDYRYIIINISGHLYKNAVGASVVVSR